MIVLSTLAARDFLVGHHGLRAPVHAPGLEGVRSLLKERRCIPLDPLDRIVTNADLVAMARIDGLTRGQVFEAVYPGHAFEHFAKERCLLPASAFPYYRVHAQATPWWRLSTRLKRLPLALIEEVYAELRERGPLAAEALSDHGHVTPLDWSGWKGTSKAATMAVEVLGTQCRVVSCGRTSRGTRLLRPARARPAGPASDAALRRTPWAAQ